ncbi:unnamed protein product [Peronospora belbahrii]|uniref:Telomeric single stranded DNA binding POT1/Cdc13 domain-containing protein n=1 Tax=Peronospora belbahrii TaxID=622444 RepID=A0ABN8CNZ1_9STRA|nr:unnamed protein product [Peronospora belbahrii]
MQYRTRIHGHGLVALQWEAGAETEERVHCVVLAERNVLKKTLDRNPRLFTYPHSLNIEVTYEEPQQLPNSDQLRYLPAKTITTRDLQSVTPIQQTVMQVQALPTKKPNRGKRTLDNAKAIPSAYRYSSLAELVSGYADIYGVVVNATLPKKTSGRDFVMTVSVTDESCSTRAEAISINVFYPTIAQMPKIKYAGDIIRFHKVKIQEYQGNIQGLGLPRVTRHLVLRERDDGKLEQLTCSESWTFEPSDEERTRQLQRWAKQSLAMDTTLSQGCPETPKLLTELKAAKGFIDLVVRVLHLDDSNEPTRLIVWDGSGNEAESDRTLVCALQDKGFVVPANGILKEVIISSCWSVLRDMRFVDGMLTHWCRFRNLAVGKNEPGASCALERNEILRFREVTSLLLMPEFVPEVQHRLLLTNKVNSDTAVKKDQPRLLAIAEPRFLNQSQRSDWESSVKVTTVIPSYIANNIPVTPMREIIGNPQTPHKFHCCARVRSMWPSDVERVCKPKPGNSGEFVYAFALTVEDGDDSLNLIVYGKDAEHFLHGIPPCDLSKSTNSKELLKYYLAALLDAPNTFHWCIKSYTVSLPSATGHSDGQVTAVRYRLFDTMLQLL